MTQLKTQLINALRPLTSIESIRNMVHTLQHPEINIPETDYLKVLGLIYMTVHRFPILMNSTYLGSEDLKALGKALDQQCATYTASMTEMTSLPRSKPRLKK